MSFFVKHKKLIIIILSVILIFILGLLYGRFIGTNGLIVKEYKVVNKKLPDSFNGLKIVHITDIHYKRTTSKKDLQELVKKINFIKPDIVVLTGDLFDRDRNLDNNQKDELMFELKKIDATINKYAIKGNHDKDESWEYIITEAGFINLNNTYDVIYNDDGTIKEYVRNNEHAKPTVRKRIIKDMDSLTYPEKWRNCYNR